MDPAQKNKNFNNFYEVASLDFYSMLDSPGIQQYNNSIHGNKNIISIPIQLCLIVITFLIETCHYDWLCTITAET